MFHNFTVLSALAEARIFPSESKFTPHTPSSCPIKVSIVLPGFFQYQRITFLSQVPPAIILPSGLKLIPRTKSCDFFKQLYSIPFWLFLSWLSHISCKVASSRVKLRSLIQSLLLFSACLRQSLIVPSRPPVVNIVPSWLKSKLQTPPGPCPLRVPNSSTVLNVSSLLLQNLTVLSRPPVARVLLSLKLILQTEFCLVSIVFNGSPSKFQNLILPPLSDEAIIFPSGLNLTT